MGTGIKKKGMETKGFMQNENEKKETKNNTVSQPNDSIEDIWKPGKSQRSDDNQNTSTLERTLDHPQPSATTDDGGRECIQCWAVHRGQACEGFEG